MPKGTMDVEIKSSFDDIQVMNFYIMLHALKNVVQGVVEQATIVDPNKLDEMLDGMFNMVKSEILEDCKKR